MLYIGLDDTDTLESRGTGHLARQIATALCASYPVRGVTRHQLLFDPRVPCTKKNSCAAIAITSNGDLDLDEIMEQVRTMMLADFQPGSDPGLCVTHEVPPDIAAFARRTQQELVTQADARSLAAAHGIRLQGLGGDEDGVIGALAAVGLAATGDDGRFVQVGRSRELVGLQPIETVLAAGIVAVRTLQGEPVTEGLIQTDKLRPACRGQEPIAIVEWNQDHWLPLKLD